MSKNFPYNVMRHRNWDKAPRVEAIATYFFPSAMAAGGISAFLAYAGTYLAVTAVTSWAISALSPKPDFSSFGSQGTLVNARDATAPVDFVYGQIRKGGTVSYYESTGEKNKFLHQIIVLAGHEVQQIGDIYVNDEIVTINASDFVNDIAWAEKVETAAPAADGGFSEGGEEYKSKIRIQKFDGSQTSAPADLLAESELTGPNALTADFVGNGIAYLYVRYEYDGEVFASGVPLITALVKGKKVYDPRTSTTAYSNNAALCIRDFITSTYGLSDNAIDDVSFSAAANESDEDVRLSNIVDAGNFVIGQQYEIKTVGTTDFTAIGASANTVGQVFVATGVGSGTGDAYRSEKRYTINGIVKASSPTGKVLGDMATACAGTLFWGSGYWKLKVGAYTAPVKTLTLDDLRGPINLQTRSSTRDSFNGVGGTFNNADGDFITADYPAIKSNVFKVEDGGDEMLLDLPLPFTTSASTAQRIAKMTLYRGREQMTISADFGLEAFNIEVGDIIAFDNDRYGFDGKEFEVIGWKFASNQEAGDLRVTLTLQETSEAAFDWNAEESEIINNNTNLPSPSGGLTVTNVTVADKGGIQKDGTFVGQALVSWTKATNSFIESYGVEWKDVDETVYQTAQSDGADNSIIISPLETGTQYDVRVRAITASGLTGSYASALPYTHGGDTTAPSPVTSLTAVGGPKNVTLDWTAPTTDSDATTLYDLKGYNVYRNTSNSEPASPAAFSGSDKFVDGGLAANTTYYYWVKAVDYSGNESTSVASGSVTTDAAVVSTDTRIYTGVVYYQTLQQAQPSTPSASSFNESTLVLGGLTSGWSESQPSVEISSLVIKEWSSKYKVEFDAQNNSTITFSTPSGAFQVTDDLESDNYAANTSGWKLERDTGDIEVNSGLFRGDITVRGDISFTNDSHTSALVGGPFGHIDSSGNINSYLDGAGLYVFVMVGGGGAGTGSDTDETSETGGGGGAGGCAIFSFDWDGSTTLSFAKGTGGVWSGGSAANGSASTFSYGGSIIATANGGSGAPSYQSTGTASGGTVSYNTGVVTLLSNIARTGGSATVSAGQACSGAGVSFFGDNGGNVTGVNNAGSDGGSPYGQTPSTSDTRLIMNLNRTFGFIGGAGATNNSPDSSVTAGDGGLFSGGGSVRSSGNGVAGVGGIGGGGGGARCDSTRTAGNGGPGGLFWSKL